MNLNSKGTATPRQSLYLLQERKQFILYYLQKGALRSTVVFARATTLYAQNHHTEAVSEMGSNQPRVIQQGYKEC